MSSTLVDFRIGIIGGCLSHQRGIPINRLYHRRLAHLLATHDGIRLKVHIVHAFDRAPARRLDELPGGESVDGVLFHLRSAFVRKSGIVVSFDRNGIRNRALHPFLFRRERHGAWEELESLQFGNASVVLRHAVSAHEYDAAPPGLRIAGLRLREMSYLLGMITGLASWAIADELWLLQQFLTVCRERHIPVFVMGPTPLPAFIVRNALCNKMNRALESRLRSLGVPCCIIGDLDGGATASRSPAPGSPAPNGGEAHMADGSHFTAEGHDMIAARLHPPFSAWLKSLRHNSASPTSSASSHGDGRA